MYGTGSINKKWAGIPFAMIEELPLNNAPQRPGQFFDDKPVDAYKLEGIHRNVSVGGAAIAATPGAGQSNVAFFLIFTDTCRYSFIDYRVSIE
jgi:hypothetical protein